MCDGFGALFIVNDRVDVALAVQADGVHLGQDNLPVKVAREIVGHRMIIGASAHSLPQAIDVQKNRADYVSCGPIWATPTKPDYEPVGIKLINFYRATLDIPFVAIGGIDEGNLDEVLKAGARTVAMVRALFNGDDVVGKVRRIKEKILTAIQSASTT
jgi:thiamine-phosphate pyrophosphorylase